MAERERTGLVVEVTVVGKACVLWRLVLWRLAVGGYWAGTPVGVPGNHSRKPLEGETCHLRAGQKAGLE